MNIDGLIAKVKSDFNKWTAQGLVEDFKLYTDIEAGLKKFGENVMTLQDEVIEVKNGKATLPSNFHSLYLAVKCSPLGYSCSEEIEPVLQSSLFWTERSEYSGTWNKCNPDECKDIEEKVIVERTYLDNKEITWYYDTVQPLSLIKGKFNSCHSKCRNMLYPESPYNIYINGLTMNTNFTEGNIYIQYYGIEKDKEGKLVIPDTPKGEVVKFLEYQAKSDLLLRIEANKDDANASRLQQKYQMLAMTQLNLALTETKAMTLTPSSFKNLEAANRRYMYQFECNLPFSV